MKPYKLQRWVEITTNVGCSNMCLYCPQKKLIKTYFAEKRPANMSFRMFKKYLRQIPKKMDICFTGLSEPLLNKDAIKMIKYASEKGYNVHLYTTFRNASLKEIKSLKNIEIKTFVIHLPDKNNLMTLQVNEEYLKKLDLFQKFDFSNVTYMCIGEVHPDIKRIIKTDIQESPVNFRAGNVEKQNYEKIKNSNVILMDSCFKEYRTEQKVICNRRFLYRGKDEAVTLPEATILLPDGSLILCCMDWGMEYVLGNLNENTYDEIVHSENMKKIQDSMMCKNNMDLLCRKCECSELYDEKKWKDFLKNSEC